MLVFKYCILLSLFIVSCTANEKNDNPNHKKFIKDSETILKDSIRKEIVLATQTIGKSYPIFDITITRLNSNTILYLRPITYYEYMEEKGNPITTFEADGKLFLVYNGFEELTTINKDNLLLIINKYDSVCKKYSITKISSTFDIEPMFFKIAGDSLVKYSDNNYEMIFYDRIIDTSKFVPYK